MTRKRMTVALKRPHYTVFSFSFVIYFFPFSLFPAKGLIWFGFSTIYHGSDPVSAVKAPKCPSCILILPMNIQQAAPVAPFFPGLCRYLATRWEEDVAKGKWH